MKKRVLIVYPGFPHYRKGIIEELLEDEEWEFHFIGDKTMMGSSIKPYDFKNSSRFTHISSYYIGPFLFHRNLFRYVNQRDFDGYIVHSAPYWISIYITVLILKLKGKPIFNWTHGILHKPGTFRAFLFKVFFQPFNGFLLYGEYAKRNMIQQGFDSKKLIVINNSLDYKSQIRFRGSMSNQELANFRSSLFKFPQHAQLIFIGRLYPQKKLSMLVDVFHLLHDQGVKYNLLIVGDGIEKEKLQFKIEEYGLSDYVNFYGSSYCESDNYKLIASSDCCISPGEVGLTAIHSMMYGTPVISHDRFDKQMPEYEVIKPGFNGDFFKYNDISSLLDTLQKWLGSGLGRDRIRSNCYERVDTLFNPDFQKEKIKGSFSSSYF